VAYGPLTEVTPFYAAEVATSDRLAYPYDIDYARSLLAGVGYGDSDDDGLLDLNGEPLKLTMVFGPWNQMPDVAQLIKDQWRDVGIDLELVQVPDFPTLAERAKAGDYDLISLYDFGVDASIQPVHSRCRATGRASDPGTGRLADRGDTPKRSTGAQLYRSPSKDRGTGAAPIRDVVNLDGATVLLTVIFVRGLAGCCCAPATALPVAPLSCAGWWRSRRVAGAESGVCTAALGRATR
jgi:ABC-type transport system substrate-binding protein